MKGRFRWSRRWWSITMGRRTGTRTTVRQQRAAEAEEIIANEQPGQVLEEDAENVRGSSGKRGTAECRG